MKKNQQELLKILRKHYKKLLNLPGVQYVDIGYKYKDGVPTGEDAIRIHVSMKHPVSFLKSNKIPKKLGGIKTDVIVSKQVLDARHGQRYSNISGGIEIQNAYIAERGTLGMVLTNDFNQLVGLTNHHVIVGDSGRRGEPVIQPQRTFVSNNDVIGTVDRWSYELDSATFILNNKRNSLPGIVGLSQSVNSVINPEMGMPVVKSGITSEITFGIIDGVSVNHSFSVIPNSHKPADFEAIAASGDSGSVWMLDDDTPSVAIGLHYASRTDGTRAYAYNISRIMRVLNLHF